jgi:hypothetical protein
MASKKKLLQAAAGSAGGAGLDVDECVQHRFCMTEQVLHKRSPTTLTLVAKVV